MRTLMSLQDSRAYFTVGNLAFELSALPKLQENIPALPLYNTSEGITPLTDTHTAAAANHDHDHAVDPHVWTSLQNAIIMARNMYHQVVKTDPAGKDFYTRRFQDLTANLQALDDSVRNALKPLAGKSFLVWHPSLSYFARDYNLHQAGMETTGKETSAAQYKQRLDKASALQPMLFFTQTEFDSREADAMAAELKVPTVKISVMQPDIAALIRYITHELTSAGH